MNINNLKICIVGCGNLGGSIANGLLDSENTISENISVTGTSLKKLEPYAQKGAKSFTDNKKATVGADIIILSVKPYRVDQILEEIQESLTPKTIIISTATGLTLEYLERKIQKPCFVYRAMPNIAIAMKESMTCISTHSEDEKVNSIVEEFFNFYGKSSFIPDSLMDAATVICASGTAFALRYLRAAIQGSVEIGFNAHQSKLLVAQTIKGAMELLMKNKSHPEAEIDKVTTPMGCTISGLNSMETSGLSPAVINGIKASYNKIVDEM